MKVLLTAFETFGGQSINSSWEAIKLIEDKIQNTQIIKRTIPVVFNKSIEVLEKLIKEENPDIVLCLGQAEGRADITIERVAINIDDARISDVEGNQPIDKTIYEDGDNAYFANIPIKAITEKIKSENIPVSVSNTAGTYVCNHIMYGLLYMINKKYNHIKGGFIHVPIIPEQLEVGKTTPTLEKEQIAKAITKAIETIRENKEDIKVSQGTIC